MQSLFERFGISNFSSFICEWINFGVRERQKRVLYEFSPISFFQDFGFQSKGITYREFRQTLEGTQLPSDEMLKVIGDIYPIRCTADQVSKLFFSQEMLRELQAWVVKEKQLEKDHPLHNAFVQVIAEYSKGNETRTFKGFLRFFLDSQGMTAEDFASYIDIPSQTVRGWLASEPKLPSEENFLKMTLALNLEGHVRNEFAHLCGKETLTPAFGEILENYTAKGGRSFHELIKETKQRWNITTARFAEIAGLDKSLVSVWLNKTFFPNQANTEILVQNFELTSKQTRLLRGLVNQTIGASSFGDMLETYLEEGGRSFAEFLERYVSTPPNSQISFARAIEVSADTVSNWLPPRELQPKLGNVEKIIGGMKLNPHQSGLIKQILSPQYIPFPEMLRSYFQEGGNSFKGFLLFLRGKWDASDHVLAHRLGVEVSSIGKWISAQAVPRESVLLRNLSGQMTLDDLDQAKIKELIANDRRTKGETSFANQIRDESESNRGL